MKTFKLTPLAGMDNASADALLQIGGDAPRIYLRDAVNVDLGEGGRARMRPGLRQVSTTPFANLWQSPLHGDVFATVGEQWVKVDTLLWSYEVLALLGEGDVSHTVLNGAVLVAGPSGIWRYNGKTAQRLTIASPPAPMVTPGAGALPVGAYAVAVSWLRADGVESAVSPSTTCQTTSAGALEVVLPWCMDESVTHARLYFTNCNGGELRSGESYPIGTTEVGITALPKLGAAAPALHLQAMPTGRYLNYWRGRLLSATANVLRFSEALAYHLHDARHGFVQMPQRITFVQPVDGGIWVGQVDHVAFLQGDSPATLQYTKRQARAPVAGSAVGLKADEAGQLSVDGRASVLWIAENGFVQGTSDGQLLESQSQHMKGISGNTGTCVVFGKRVLAALI